MVFLVIAEALAPTGVGLYQLIGYNLLVVSAILALRVLVGIFRERQRG
ncbi:hypothetical protein N5079_34635 [Planotetraspora sp. A-T 1434]|nr:hypothetical protein [Planotetraspora sp. A-T 1434]MCT9935353.1 hypothetical protein [Planotetraspora sp. A-T 1434]